MMLVLNINIHNKTKVEVKLKLKVEVENVLDNQIQRITHSLRMSESPPSMMARVEHLWYLPQAVPKAMLFPL